MSRRSKRAFHEVDARVHSLALRYVDSDKSNVRAAASLFAQRLAQLAPLELKRLEGDPKSFELLAQNVFRDHAPEHGIEMRKDSDEEQRENLATKQDMRAALSFGRGTA